MPSLAFRNTVILNNFRGLTMPTYAEYLAYAASRGFQPMKESTFDSLIACGFNPITSEWDSLADDYNNF